MRVNGAIGVLGILTFVRSMLVVVDARFWLERAKTMRRQQISFQGAAVSSR